MNLKSRQTASVLFYLEFFAQEIKYEQKIQEKL